MRTLALALALCGACTANDAVPAAVAGAVTPDHGAAGAVVQITGTGFCQRPDTGQEDPTCMTAGVVVFGATPATPTTWDDTAITVEVPPAAPGATTVALEIAGRTSNALPFTIE